MKRTAFLLFLLASSAIFLSSCFDNTFQKRNITGKAGEMIIVIPKEAWSGAPGTVLRKILNQPQLGLPQEEPIFSLIDVPPAAFNDIFRTTRNIITVRISSTIDEPVAEYKNDVWAHPQAVVNINAKSQEEFEKLFLENSDKIVAFFLKAEKDRLMGNYKQYSDKVVYNTLLKSFNLKMNVPPGFKVVKKTDDFAWLRYETTEISQWIFIYTYKYESDSTFTPDFQLAKRDEYLKKYVPGPRDSTYMTTERQIIPLFNIFEHNGNHASEMRGLWRVENDFMGGPFISIAELDASNNRIVTVEGSVYAPRFDKRNYLRQVEAIVYSMEFPDQAKNDKIMSEIKSGN
ncbi:MAG: hypothetical protein A2W90_06615 [Bacteroidetes bacterium GWF2_42_66]|nr:MAG: hypothetical protein A2W92_02045 [Bacteroidetes bacterium GWA2_42_15]OFY02827.1 MAG: hypothetical protein A2W89_24025 [Bacteroidetes bacterium GWE2_42_39]OFY44481.1 MAG: hypothetical protein A2W90_06615 [Bacteroidetes bacterium GWF2_42_66]HBL74974.1 hypothetical protein [Prolixibacteraceae bacterium]HCR90087.1 hypothetical protein [Prolixibacteraceae bacterium]